MLVDLLTGLGYRRNRRRRLPARRQLRPAARLEVLALEDRLPISEQVGPFLTVAALSATSDQAAPQAPFADEPASAAKSAARNALGQDNERNRAVFLPGPLVEPPPLLAAMPLPPQLLPHPGVPANAAEPAAATS